MNNKQIKKKKYIPPKETQEKVKIKFFLIYAGSGGGGVTSDLRLKKNIKTLSNVLNKLDKVRSIRFQWKNTDKKLGIVAGEEKIGLIAQDVQKVFPELVMHEQRGYRMLDYSELTAILVEAVKELRSENIKLHKRLLPLENRQ